MKFILLLGASITAFQIVLAISAYEDPRTRDVSTGVLVAALSSAFITILALIVVLVTPL